MPKNFRLASRLAGRQRGEKVKAELFHVSHPLSLIKNLTKKRALAVPFLKLAGFVLGKKYELSLVLTGDALIKKLNNTYRRKNQPTNILSFPYSETEGEIFINLKRAELESKRFERNFNHHLAYLFIHGLLHLKGFAHGSKMESEECKILKHFKKSLRTF